MRSGSPPKLETEAEVTVNAWLARAAGRSTNRLIRAFGSAFDALWQRAYGTLGEVTLTAIVGTVIRRAAAEYPLLSALEVTTSGLRTSGLERPPGLRRDDVSEALRFVLVQVLTVLGDLTAQILTPALHAALHESSSIPKRVVRSRIATSPPIPTDYGRLEPLYEIQTVLAQPISIEQACDAIVPIVTRVLRVRTVEVLDTAPGLHRALVWATAGSATTVVDEAHEHAREALRSLVSDDMAAASSVSRSAILLGGVAEPTVPRHFVTLPLVLHGRVFGVFQLEGGSAFSERDLLFVNVVAHQLAVALDRHHVQLELEATRSDAERANRRLRELQAIFDAALDGTTLDESLGAALRTMSSVFGADAAAILLVSPDGTTLRRRCSIGLQDDDSLEVRIGSGAAGRIAAGTTAVFFDDLSQVTGVSPVLLVNGIRSLLGAPMHARNRMTGVVYVASRGGRTFDDDERQLLGMAADRIGTIIDNAALYEQALAAIRSRDAVMGVVSHDLRNPLGAIQMCAELFAAGDPQLAKPVAIVKRSVDVMVRLISDLRDVGCIEAGHLSIQTRREAADDLIHDAIDGIRDGAAQKSLRVAVKTPRRAVFLDCDRIRIIQVLTNLLSNAIKFTPRGGTITLSMTDGQPGQARFSVEDTGSGISEADLPYVFDRYWQAKATAHLGTGLGLAISKGIVEAHGGAISVTSRVGRGTTFSFTLRLAPAGVLGARRTAAEPLVRAAE